MDISQPRHLKYRRSKSRPKPIPFQAGPAIKPYATLLSWLNSDIVSNKAGKSRRLIKLPVCIQRLDNDPLGLGPAHIGTTPNDLRQGAILLTLDDSALGLSLFSVFQTRCLPETAYCTLWIEGYWGPLLPPSDDTPSPLNSSSEARGPFPFAVLRIGDTFCEQEYSGIPGMQAVEPPTAFIY